MAQNPNQIAPQVDFQSLAARIIPLLSPSHRAAVEALVKDLARLEQLEVIRGNVSTEPMVSPLTLKESEILCYAAQGYSNKRVADILGCKKMTVTNHISSIMRKMDCLNRTHAVTMALMHGWIRVHQPKKGI